MLSGAKNWARNIKRDVIALWIAGRDPRVPWYAKALCLVVAAYALSPIDLIPDFIPLIGYLDDLVLLPVGILLAVRLIPPDLMLEFRREATVIARRPTSQTAAVVIILLWIGLATVAAWSVWIMWWSVPEYSVTKSEVPNRSAAVATPPVGCPWRAPGCRVTWSRPTWSARPWNC